MKRLALCLVVIVVVGGYVAAYVADVATSLVRR